MRRLLQALLHTTACALLACDLVVEIQEGKIRGTHLTSSRSNNTFYGFMGIPYAKPPVGDLRFKPPQPPASWCGVLNTTEEGPSCPQSDTSGEEDCLYLNVYTPKLTAYPRMVVMVWIHGGDFIMGSGNRDVYGPDFFMDEDIVLVTLNYRLGIFGFLSLQNKEVPGNNGLKDQVSALQWVQRNIEYFGGDPRKVTIFGESAGGACVHYHLLSPLSKGLFRYAISESGSALNPWAYQTPESSVETAFDIGKYFGFHESDPDKLLKFLKKVEPDDFVRYIDEKLLRLRLGPLVGPTLDTKAPNGETFLPDTPINLLDSGAFHQVPYITGMNNEEAILITKILKKGGIMLRPVTAIFRFALPYFAGHEIEHPWEMALEVKSKYFSNSRPLVLKYIDALTDMFFGVGVFCTAQKHAAYTTVYNYEFCFNGTANVIKDIFGGGAFPGAAHADELAYLFKINMVKVDLKRGTPEYKTSRRMLRMWTNFAKTGNPTPGPDPVLANITWPSFNGTDYPYISINKTLSVSRNLNGGNALWWQELFKNYTTGGTPCWTAH